MADNKNEIAELRKEIDQLKARAPTVHDPAADARWRDSMHQMAEARARHMGGFSDDDLRAFEQAAPTSVVRDIAMRDGRAPTSPSSQGAIPSSQQGEQSSLAL